MSISGADAVEAKPEEALPDEEIVRRILAGDSPLYELIMRRYNQRLYRVARGMLGNDAEAEDTVQQAYVDAYRHLEQFSGRARFSTWLTKIAVHEASRRRHRRRRITSLAEAADDEVPAYRKGGESIVSEEPDPERAAASAEMRGILESVVDSLRPAYRSVFMLREIEGLSTADTAECLEISPEAVKVRLHRGKIELRKALARQADLAGPASFSFLGARCDRMVDRVFAALDLPPRRPAA